MTKARYSILLAALVAFATVGRGQSNEQSSTQRLDTRTISVYTALGFLEVFVLGVQYQVNDEFALGVKADLALVAGHDLPDGGSGGGIKGSYFFSRTGAVNVVNLESSYVATGDGGALLLEATIGHDAIEGRGMGFLWLIGIARGGFAGERDRPLYFPAVKIGMHIDL